MPRTVYVPELGRAFSFADGTSDEAVSAFFQKNFPAPPPSAAEVAPTPEAPVGPDESGIFGRFAYGFGTGLTNIPGGIASLFYPAEEAAQTTAGQFSEEARKYLEETLGIDPTKDPTAAQQAAQALGSVASFLVPGSAAAKGAALAGRTAAAAGRVGTATAAAQGVALGTEARAERIRDQLASGMEISEEDQLAAQRLSGLIGASEALPLGRFFGPISTLLSKVPVSKAPIVEQIVKSRLAKITKAGVAEGAQEVASGIANDLVERGVYNPDVEIGQDLMSNFGTGAFAGSFVEGVIQLAAGRKLRPYRQLQEDLGREAAVNAQAQRQGEISRAAEELRKVNVEGDVEVIEDDFDGISRFTIRTPGGNTVGDFLDPAEAEEAVNIYKQRTDANVTVRKPADLPSVFPVKINGKEYQTTDEIIADRDSLVSKAEGLAAYMSRPDVIKREAARQNVSEALVKKATAEEVADLDKQIVKLNEFVAAAKPRPAEGIEAGDLRSQFAAPEAVVPEAIAPEAPIGAVEPVSVEAPITGAPAIAEPVEPSVAPTEPEKPRTSVGQLKEAPVRRRTLTQAEAEGPILRDYNQATIDRYASIYTALKSRLSGKVPKNAEVNLEELISTDKNLLVRGQARAVKTPNGIKSIVDLSTGILRPDMSVEAAVKELVGTLNHEIIHVLRDQGVIRPAEWNILSKAVVNTKVPGKKYTYMDKAQAIYTPYGQPITPVYTDPDAVIEEAVAEMYKDWVNNQTAPVQTRGLFNRITEFFRSIFRVLKSNKYEEVFRAIDTGEVGAREGLGRDADTRLSAANMPPESNAQKTQIPGTFPTYKKASEILNKEKPDGKQLDFGAGLGMSQQLGFDTFEPYPRSGFTPTYNDSGDIQPNSYDKIVNLNVLNVVPIETRSKIVKEIGRILSPGGVAIITTRGRDVMSAKGTPGPEPMSVITSANTYQKGFTSPELTEYVSRELGEGFVVERLNLGPAGVIIRKSGDGAVETARFSAAPALNTEEFARWFRNSKVVNPDGTPKVMYHGTGFDFDRFGKSRSGAVKKGLLKRLIPGDETGPFYFSASTKFANQYATQKLYKGGRGEDIKSGGRMIPVYISAQNPFDFDNPDHINAIRTKFPYHSEGFFETIQNGNWADLEQEDVQRAIRDLGFDGFYLIESGFKNLAVYNPVQVKSIFNQFEEGTATSPRLSAAPLPPYVEAKNRTLFVPERKESVFQSISDFFRGPTTMPKTLNTVYGQIDMKGGYFGTRANLYRRMSLVDQDAYIEFLEKTANEKDTGNFQRREATQSAIAALGWARRSSQLTAATVMQGPPVIEYSRPGDIQSATVAIRDDADKLIDIFRVMLEPGPVDPVTGEPRDKRVVFKSYATAKRAIGLKAAGKPVPRELDDVYINTTIQSVQRDYPEIVEAYEKYQRFNKKLITAARDAGRITDAELAKFTQQMDYYGFYRELYEEELVPGMPSKLAGDIKIREYKGSQRGELIEDPMLVILTNVNFWMGAITRNIAVNKSFKLAKDMGEARLLGASEKPDLSQGESEQVMFFRENGVQKRFAVKDPMLVISLGADDRINMGGAMNLLGVMPATVLRESITRDPVFMVRNLLRDTLSSWITSGEDITPFIGTVKGFRDALNNSTSFQALVGRGVVGSHDLAMRSPAEMAAIIRRRALPVNVMNVASIDGMQGLVMSAWDKLGVWSEASDAATRIAVYESAIKQGMSEAEAAFRAIEIMNFSRRGSNSFLQILTQIIPFLNARIQGMDVLYQAGKAGVMTATGYQLGERDANLGKKFLYRGAMLAALSVALEMMLDGDEDYEELPDYVKNGNLLIPLKWFGVEGGYFAAIPKPFEAGLLFSTIPQEMYKATTGQTSGREMAKFFWSEFTSTFGFNPIPQAMIPGLEALINYDFYTDLPLISEGKARLTPELQYDSRTSSVAMMLSGVPIKYNFTTGKFEGVSPIIIDQIISGYGGPMGSYLMQGVGLLMEGAGSVGIDIAPERLPRDITQLPAIKSFLLDAESRSPKSVAQAYELFRVVDEVNRSFSRLRQTGDVEATMDYLERNKDVLAYKKYIYKLFDGLNKISARERQIERDETMTREQKFEAMKQLREVRARLTSNIAEINKALGR